jgi:hypothetical protein
VDILSWEGVPKGIENYQGFVYIIHNPKTGKYYIGKKNFWKVIKYPPLKGRKNKRHKRVESDWKDYWGSSEMLKKDIEKFGKDSFIRQIIKLCKDKWEMSYYELQKQMEFDVLFDKKAYNNIVNVRIKGRK